RQRARVNFRSTRSGQRPVQRAVVEQRVEIELARIAQAESVGVTLARLGDRAVDLGTKGQRRRRVGNLLGIEAVIDRTRVAYRAFDEQRVGPGRRQRLRANVAETLKPHLLSVGVNQPPSAAPTGQTLRIEIKQISGIGLETVELRIKPRRVS